MKVYLINLDRHAERLAHATAEFRRLGLEFERLPAIDGFALQSSDVSALSSRLSRGELGCLLSHREAWRRIAEGPEPFAAVFEDDIHLADWAGDFLRDADWVPPGTAIVKLETMLKPVLLGRTAMPTRRHCALAALQSAHMGSAGYVLASTAAPRLLEAGISAPSDTVLFRIAPASLPVLQLDPALCVQDTFHPIVGARSQTLGSTINEERKATRRVQQAPLARLVEKARLSINKRTRRLRARVSGADRMRVVPFRPSDV
jgi:glycosyl transferase family 25